MAFKSWGGDGDWFEVEVEDVGLGKWGVDCYWWRDKVYAEVEIEGDGSEGIDGNYRVITVISWW